MTKNFILGVGAQKAGTTWLHAYLARQSSFNMGCMKEYHIWDALTFEEGRNFLPSNYREIYKKTKLIPYTSYKSYIRYKMKSAPGFYGQYFSGLIKGKIISTGDITPAYSVLSSDIFTVIKKELESVGFLVKVIFLLRDPFERCWSAVRMKIKKSKYSVDVSEALKDLFSSRDYLFRTDYKRTIEALESVFDSENIYYGIYEEMFLKDRIEQISSFCKIKPDFEFVSKKINVSEKLVDVDKNLKKDILSYYSNIYKFCYDRFPQTRLLWNNIKQK